MRNRGTLSPFTACLFTIVAIAGFAPRARARMSKSLCVNASGAGNCFTTIKAALKVARTGDSIAIAAGTYNENIQIGVNSKKGRKIYLFIMGAGPGSTIIDGGSNGTVVSIFPQALVSMEGVTIRNGSASGIAVRDATLILGNSAVVDNQGAPTVPGANSTGGGIDFEVSRRPPQKNPALIIENCTISGNTANGSSAANACGGGLATTGGATNIFNSTISGNTTLGNGNGGGICSGGPTYIANSTISGNQATGGEPLGGGIYYTALLFLNNVTISNNSCSSGIGKGGGIFSLSAAATVANTILAGNAAITQPDCGGNLNSQGHNLIQNNSCSITGDTMTNILGENPMLGPLQLNAPGTTATQALMMGSPAIKAGFPGANYSKGQGPHCLPKDQRGVFRPTNACDIGAYQFSM
jgi:hypothetical protein